MRDKTTISVRMSPEIHAALEDAATRDHRSQSGQAVYLIERGLRDAGRLSEVVEAEPMRGNGPALIIEPTYNGAHGLEYGGHQIKVYLTNPKRMMRVLTLEGEVRPSDLLTWLQVTLEWMEGMAEQLDR